jgi:glycosyltransferase involved in cell wall biosynthesis
MPRVLVISAHRFNRSPSQRYRYEQYIPYLQQHGFDFTFSPILSEKDDKVFYAKGHALSKGLILLRSVFTRLKDCLRYNDFDIIFIQREALFVGSNFFERKAFKSKAQVIFDFDDSIWLMDTSPENKKWEWLKKPGKTRSNIQHAHVVIAGNLYLKAYADRYNKNTVLIPTTVDCNVHIPKPGLRNKESVVIGWSGSISTIKHFELLVPVLEKLKRKYGSKISFKVLGDAAYVNRELGIIGKAWSASEEVDDINAFDIGIMPLPNDEWAKGKCGLKGLTFMACGVPTVMSSVGVNTEIIQHGENGFLVSSEEEWIHCLSQLIESSELREQLGRAGRETVVTKYSVEANKEKYLRICKEAVK